MCYYVFMSKSKSKLIGVVSSPVKIMPNLAPPPSLPMAVSTPMLQAVLDRRLLTNEERRSLTGHFPIDILYIKNLPMGHRGNRLYLFLEQRDANNNPQLKLIPYEGVTDQSDHQNVIRAYQNLGYNVSNTISNEMSWRMGRMIIHSNGQWAQILINGMSPFTSNFVLAEAAYSPNPPYTVNLKEVRFERRQIPNRPIGDLGIDYQSMNRPRKISRTSTAGEILVTREESKSITPVNLLIVGGLLFAGIYAYDKLKKK